MNKDLINPAHRDVSREARRRRNKNKRRRVAEINRLLKAGIASSGTMSSGMGRTWKHGNLAKAKDKTASPIVQGGLPSLGKKR
jgi:hypothetical protein